MKSSQGFTVVEMLIALAIIGIAFGALALSQVNSLRASARSQHVSEVKAAANRVLEETMSQVLQVKTPANSTLEDGDAMDDDDETGIARSFLYVDYYYQCVDGTVTLPSEVRDGSTSNLRAVDCEDTLTGDSIETTWDISRASGILSEGILTVTVTGTHTQTGASVTLGNRITCYDIYPSPSATTPDPCPQPASSGTL